MFCFSQSAIESSGKCIKGLININIIEDLNKIKETNETGDFIASVCELRNKAFDCIIPISNAMDPCMSKDEILLKNSIIKVARSTVDFGCKNAKQLTIFMNGEGRECIKPRGVAIDKCFNETYGQLVAQLSHDMSIADFKSMISQFICADTRKLEKCVINELKSCTKNTVDLANALFRHIENEKTCEALSNLKSSAFLNSLSVLGLIISMIIVNMTNILKL